MATVKELEAAVQKAKAAESAANSMVIGTARAIAEKRRQGLPPGDFLLEALADASARQRDLQEDLIKAHTALVAGIDAEFFRRRTDLN